jgi:hypothetical protein
VPWAASAKFSGSSTRSESPSAAEARIAPSGRGVFVGFAVDDADATGVAHPSVAKTKTTMNEKNDLDVTPKLE